MINKWTFSEDQPRMFFTSVDARAIEICPSLALMPGFSGYRPPDPKRVSTSEEPASNERLAVVCLCGCGRVWPSIGQAAKDLGASRGQLGYVLAAGRTAKRSGHILALEKSTTESTEAA